MEKEKTYQLLLKQVESLIEGENNAVGQLANTAALLHETMGWWWTGFYLVNGDTLQLGPFQGPIACYNIKRGRGVCGTAWQEDRTIVVPLHDGEGNIAGVLDIDSKEIATFDEVDAHWLEEIARVIKHHVFTQSGQS